MLECGIGGRIDATNICNSVVTAITSIGIDHCEVLGHTIEEICHEKCGIIKKTQVFVGPTVPLEVVYQYSDKV